MEHAFGPYMKQLREQQGFSINQLAEAAGISNSQISRIENGVRGVPKPATIRKIADALAVPYSDMMKQAGYMETGLEANPQEVPEWATYKDRRDFKKMLEDDDDLMFDGIPLDEEDKKRIKDVLTGLFWEAKQMNKRKKPGESDQRP
ncbi:Transcriptional regulator, contains XRE-family HTH domain [Paenibacillus polysaccharolyticus]|uniref:Transcriptional regulator, contains XRE-family HTH domain n=2 Tax=Paenibacillus TaxID=44249 RepID=A0A1G5GGQ5_9BACL|nr:MULTISPECIES: transcriptional regulator [Paenibacillus]MDP9700646.1 transcriptional regulator with XRE-family HTH domain [Paenibacillus intestini]SCY50527.1 Transcriptional regulator, contains XRE-family HTH domain [Paenibacillus polysaccharolyticus]